MHAYSLTPQASGVFSWWPDTITPTTLRSSHQQQMVSGTGVTTQERVWRHPSWPLLPTPFGDHPFRLLKPQVSTSSPMTAVPAPVIVPSTPTRRPVGALLRLGDPAMLFSPVMFSANGNLLFSPEVDDDDDGNTLKLAKAAHVFSPIRVWQCAERSRMERPASRLQCKSSEVGTCGPTVAGTGTSTREVSDASVKMPADSLVLTACWLGR